MSLFTPGFGGFGDPFFQDMDRMMAMALDPFSTHSTRRGELSRTAPAGGFAMMPMMGTVHAIDIEEHPGKFALKTGRT